MSTKARKAEGTTLYKRDTRFVRRNISRVRIFIAKSFYAIYNTISDVRLLLLDAAYTLLKAQTADKLNR